MTGQAPRPRGEGPGAITRDGCAVEVYLKLPYRGELEVLASHLASGCAVLELGCGAGRLTRRLLDAGHPVTAVDYSEEMLHHVPDTATRIHSDIERLDLHRTFDVVLLASNLVNTADVALRDAQLAACRRHLAPRGQLLFQRFDPAWLRAVEPGPFPSIGEVAITIERVEREGDAVAMTIRYAIGDAEWRHRFSALVLDDDAIERVLLQAGFAAVTWIDARWGAAVSR